MSVRSSGGFCPFTCLTQSCSPAEQPLTAGSAPRNSGGSFRGGDAIAGNAHRLAALVAGVDI